MANKRLEHGYLLSESSVSSGLSARAGRGDFENWRASLK